MPHNENEDEHEDQREREARVEKRRHMDRLTEYVRVYWPLLVALFFAVSTWAEQRTKVADVADAVATIKAAQTGAVTQVQINTTEIAVLKANVVAIKESVADTKTNTERIINRLDRMNK